MHRQASRCLQFLYNFLFSGRFFLVRGLIICVSGKTAKNRENSSNKFRNYVDGVIVRLFRFFAIFNFFFCLFSRKRNYFKSNAYAREMFVNQSQRIYPVSSEFLCLKLVLLRRNVRKLNSAARQNVYILDLSPFNNQLIQFQLNRSHWTPCIRVASSVNSLYAEERKKKNLSVSI